MFVVQCSELEKIRGPIFWKKAKIFQVQMAVFMFRRSEILKPERNPVQTETSTEDF